MICWSEVHPVWMGVLRNNEISARCEFNLSRWPTSFRLCLTNLTRAISIRSWKVGFVVCNGGCLGACPLDTEGDYVLPCRLYRGIRRSKYTSTYWSLLQECDLSEVFKQFWYVLYNCKHLFCMLDWSYFPRVFSFSILLISFFPRGSRI